VVVTMKDQRTSTLEVILDPIMRVSPLPTQSEPQSQLVQSEEKEESEKEEEKGGEGQGQEEGQGQTHIFFSILRVVCSSEVIPLDLSSRSFIILSRFIRSSVHTSSSPFPRTFSSSICPSGTKTFFLVWAKQPCAWARELLLARGTLLCLITKHSPGKLFR
jgi:hypothetical protein